MPKLLFTDAVKADLAKEAGITGVPDTNIFNREYDPSSGEEKLYIKQGSSKFFGAKPRTVASTNPIEAQTEYLRGQTEGKTMQDVYSAYMSSTPPSKQAIMDEIGGGPSGIYDTIDGIEQQKQALIRLRAKAGSQIFTAKNPDGTDIDPRVKVAEFKAQQAGIAQQEANLNSMQDIYKAQLQALTDSELNLRQKEQERNKIAVDYMKEMNDQANEVTKLAQDRADKDRNFNLDSAKLAESKRQFNLENGIETTSTPTVVDPAEVSTYSMQKRGTENLQCGQLVNDYILKATGKDPTGDMRFEDTYEDKVKAVDTIGKANAPEEGGIFVSNPLKTTAGHTGIIQTRYADGSFDALEANASGKKDGEKPKITRYTAEQAKSMVFSKSVQKVTEKSTSTKKVDYSTFLKGLPLKDIDFTPEQTQGLIDATLADYPEKSEKDVIDSLINVAPPKVKASLKAQKAVPLVKAEIEKKDGLDKEGVKSTLTTLTDEGISPKNAISTLFKAGFFDKYTAGFFGDDDQYDAVQEFADENKIDLKQILKDLNTKK